MTQATPAGRTPQQSILDAVAFAFFHLPLWMWRIFALSILVTLYVSVMARGVAYSFPDFGVKLSKTPFLAFLARYEETKNLQIAHPFALLFLIVVFVSWEMILRMACGDESAFERFAKPEAAKRIMVCIGTGVLVTDCWFYYSGITNSGWKGAAFSFSALLATLGFLAVNVAVSMFSVFLSPRKESANV